MKLIQEQIQESKTEIKEENGTKSYTISGIFLQSAVKNGNGRIYPTEVLREAVDVYGQSFISKNRGYGELGHPTEPGIHLDRVCLLTKSLQQEGNDFIGSAKIIPSPTGKIVMTLIDEGVSLGVSSRGVGELKNGYIQPGFRLVTAVDVVADPSAPDAFVSALVENKEWVMVNGVWTEQQADELRTNVLKANSAHLDEAKSIAWAKFMNLLGKKI